MVDDGCEASCNEAVVAVVTADHVCCSPGKSECASALTSGTDSFLDGLPWLVSGASGVTSACSHHTLEHGMEIRLNSAGDALILICSFGLTRLCRSC